MHIKNLELLIAIYTTIALHIYANLTVPRFRVICLEPNWNRQFSSLRTGAETAIPIPGNFWNSRPLLSTHFHLIVSTSYVCTFSSLLEWNCSQCQSNMVDRRKY